MPITIDGSGTITGLSVGGLPNGTVQPADLSTGAPTWDTSGNVGIGATPSAWNTSFRALEVGAGGNSIFSATGGGNTLLTNNAYYNNSGNWIYSRSAAASHYEQNGGVHKFLYAASGTAGNTISWSEAARIDSGGNFIIKGTGAATNEAVDSLSFSGVNSGTPYIVSNSSSTSRNRLFFQYNSTIIGTISTSTTATAYNTSSDYRLKENVQPMTGALAKVAALKPVTYTWKADGSDGEGFIAHELAEVCPGAVSGEKDAVDSEGNIIPQGIDTSFLVATLTAAIQELNAKVDAQAAEIAALKGAA